MKKVLFVLAILVLISGCAQEKTVEAPVGVPQSIDETSVAEVPQDTIESLGDDSYLLKQGESATLDNHEFLIKSIDVQGSLFRIDIDGTDIVFHGTKEKEIVNGLEMYVDKLQRASPSEYNLIVHITDFSLGENEYLIRQGFPQSISGMEISVNAAKIDSSKRRSIPITLDGEDAVIYEGETYSFDKAEVMNVKTFALDKSYAIIKISIL